MRRARIASSVVLIAALLAACSHTLPTVPTEETRSRPEGWTETGDASWYGEPYHGRQTASGEIYDMHEMTAAHRSLPFDTLVKITRRDTGADVKVRITDRGPFIKGRIIDLSLAAARVIGLDVDGVAPVKIKVVGQAKPQPTSRSITTEGDPCLWVQVGAFGDAKNAQRARDGLVANGEKAIVIEGPGGLDRVRIGPFDDAKEAERALNRLRTDWPVAQLVECGG